MEAVDLKKLEQLFEMASFVSTLRDLYEKPDSSPDNIGLRHDVDDRGWDSVLAMAQWEKDRGIRSTWYFLHTAPYWSHLMGPTLRSLVYMGHEIGIHNNAIAENKRTGEDPFIILERAITELCDWSGVPIRTTAAHGDLLCHQYGFVNYDMFTECQKQRSGSSYDGPKLPLATLGLEYAGDWLPRAAYMTDSGGIWNPGPANPTLDDALEEFPYAGRMIILQHPDWWPKALYE
jgi:hypothetical protein